MKYALYGNDIDETTNYTINQLQGATIGIDTNQRLIDGRPNPYFGLPFIYEGAGGGLDFGTTGNGSFLGLHSIGRVYMEDELPLFEGAVQRWYAGGHGRQRSRFQRFSSNELLTTDTELIAIAAPANTGLRSPSAASGMPITL